MQVLWIQTVDSLESKNTEIFLKVGYLIFITADILTYPCLMLRLQKLNIIAVSLKSPMLRIAIQKLMNHLSKRLNG
jgi:hypothetical protein